MEKTWVWPEAQSDQWIVNFGGRFLMVWGCAPAQGVDHMCMIDRRIDAELHTIILQVEFLAIVEFCWLDRLQLTFQQDNDPKDTFKKASKWFQ
jgi:hypothetical protein